MNGNDYSLIMDILYKFHSSSDWIKLVWLICFTAIILGSLWFIHDMIKIRTKAKETEPPGEIAQ